MKAEESAEGLRQRVLDRIDTRGPRRPRGRPVGAAGKPKVSSGVGEWVDAADENGG